MKVLKFGGTSVGSVESLANVKSIVEAIDGPAIVVVSALGGLTDKLIATARMAAANDVAFREEMEAISSRHFHIISNVVAEESRPEVISRVAQLLNDLKRVYDGIFLLRHLPAETLDMVVSFGERMSSVIVAAMVSGGSLHDSMTFVKTEEWFGKNVADQKLTESLIKEEFKEPFCKAVVPGFISTDRTSGRITNLGRGGSDFTAALVAAALDAEVLEIWTDVDGFMTADPRIIPEAQVVGRMSFVESMELCTFGAKVIYPPTIYPVFHKNIPIKILNTFNPQAPGTLVCDPMVNPPAESERMRFKGVTALRDTSLVGVAGDGSESISELETRTLNALARNGVKVYSMTGCLGCGLNLAVASDDAAKAVGVVASEFAPEISSGSMPAPELRQGLSTIAVVGENMKDDLRLGARIRNSLMRAGIRVAAYSEGVSETTMTFMVEAGEREAALRIVHSLLF